jgi:hypothetical protein
MLIKALVVCLKICLNGQVFLIDFILLKRLKLIRRSYFELFQIIKVDIIEERMIHHFFCIIMKTEPFSVVRI